MNSHSKLLALFPPTFLPVLALPPNISSVDITDPFKKHYSGGFIGLHFGTWRIPATRPRDNKLSRKEETTQHEKHRYLTFEREWTTMEITEFRKAPQYFLNISGKRKFNDLTTTKFLQECLNVSGVEKDLRDIVFAQRLRSPTQPLLVLTYVSAD